MPVARIVDDLCRALRGAARVTVLGVGQELLADDGVGILVLKELQRLCDGSGGGLGPVADRVQFVAGGVAPENHTGQIRRFGPTHVVIIDAADFETEPGTTRVIGVDDIRGVTFSTHMLPLTIFARFITESIGADVVVVGVQPQNVDFGDPTPAVRAAAAALARDMATALQNVLVPDTVGHSP